MKKRLFSGLLAFLMAFMLMPVTALAYVGPLTETSSSASQSGDTVTLKNAYMSAFIRQDGTFAIEPAGRTVSDVTDWSRPEIEVYSSGHTGGYFPYYTDGSTSLRVSGDTAVWSASLSEYPFTVEITYQIVAVEDGAHSGSTEGAVGSATSNTKRAYALRSYCRAKNTASVAALSEKNIVIAYNNIIANFGANGHSVRGSIRADLYTKTVNESTWPSTVNKEHATSTLNDETQDVSVDMTDEAGKDVVYTELYTDSFSNANEFMALGGYMKVQDGSGVIDGVVGHAADYSYMYSVLNPNHVNTSTSSQFEWHINAMKEKIGDNTLNLLGDKVDLRVRSWYTRTYNEPTVPLGFEVGIGSMLYGFRDLYTVAEQTVNPPAADPATLAEDASYLGIVGSAYGQAVITAASQEDLGEKVKASGRTLLATFTGSISQSVSEAAAGVYAFTGGCAQLAPCLTASWLDKASRTSFTVRQNDNNTVTVSANQVSLSTPATKFYIPKTAAGLTFTFKENGFTIAFDPDNNDALLYLDIPCAACKLTSVTPEPGENRLVFTGELSIPSSILSIAGIKVSKLEEGVKNGHFGVTGIAASGTASLGKLMGMQLFNAKADIDTFSENKHYSFSLQFKTDVFSAEGTLTLKPIASGALIPDELYFGAALNAGAGIGLQLVPPTPVVTLTGVGGGFSGLAATVSGNYGLYPPLRMTIDATGQILGIFGGKLKMTTGMGYFSLALTQGTIAEVDVLSNLSYTTALSETNRTAESTVFSGLEHTNDLSLKIDAPSDLPILQATGQVKTDAFAGKSVSGKKILLCLGSGGSLATDVSVPKGVWLLGGKKLVGAKFEYTMDGSTVFTEGSSLQTILENITGFGAISYTSSILSHPYRIYYIFNSKEIGFDVGNQTNRDLTHATKEAGSQMNYSVQSKSGSQTGLISMADNFEVLASSAKNLNEAAPVGTSGNGVTIGGSGSQYTVKLDSTAPALGQLSFVLTPGSGTAADFATGITVKDGSDPITLVPAEFDANGKVTNEAAANLTMSSGTAGNQSENWVALNLSGTGPWTISATGDFTLSCVQTKPIASIAGISLSGSTLSYTLKDLDSSKSYELCTYLGSTEGSRDILLDERSVTGSGTLDLSLAGNLADTGSYYVTAALREKVTTKIGGNTVTSLLVDGVQPAQGTVPYTNSEKPAAPASVILTSIGSEALQAEWSAVDGATSYRIHLYQLVNGTWTDTGAGYEVPVGELTKTASGTYSYKMAVTAKGTEKPSTVLLTADQTYRVTVQACKSVQMSYDVNNDNAVDANDVIARASAAAMSDANGVLLPAATYPVLTYSPVPVKDENNSKVLSVAKAGTLTVTSDVSAAISVTWKDNSGKVTTAGASSGPVSSLSVQLPDVDGTVTLTVVATDKEGDITTDYLTLQIDKTAPVLVLDGSSVVTDGNGTFTLTGKTEAGAKVSGGAILPAGSKITVGGLTSAVAAEDGSFAVTGTLGDLEQNSSGNVVIRVTAVDAVKNVSAPVYMQVIQGTAPSFNTTESKLPLGVVGKPYSSPLPLDGSVPFVMNVTDGSLPDGLTLNSDGTLSGTPAKAGTFTFAVKATNAFGTDSMQLTMTVAEAPVIIEGAGSSWQKGSGGDLRFVSSADNALFDHVEVDQQTLSESNFDRNSGSTIITLKNAYLETLPAGSHALSIVSSTGAASTTFTVTAAAPSSGSSSSSGSTPSSSASSSGSVSPNTGDRMMPGLFLAAALLAAAGIAGLAVYRRKRRV